MEILNLNLKKQWFDMTLSGVKKEEYRELTTFWFMRLVFKPDKVIDYFGYSNFKKLSDASIQDMFSRDRGMIAFNPYNVTRLMNGMSTHAPVFTIEHKGIRIGEGNPEWGAESGKKYFIISHGEILETRNIKH